MALMVNMRRGWMFALALLLFLVAVGPACLLSASAAIAMPAMGHSPVKTSDCDVPSKGSMGACPHEAQTKDRSVSSSPLDAPIVPAVLPTAVVIPAAEATCEGYRGEVGATSAPPAYLTPLRL